jgi:GT2 family glycosyltransferase
LAQEWTQEPAQEIEPFVSVILPVRNEAAWIARSLGAVLTQRYPADRMDIVLVDGGSDDDTLGIVRSLSGAERVRILTNPRRNQAAGMNIGIGAVRGAIVVRVDGHTVIAPDYVSACVAALAATGAAAIGGRMDPVGLTPTGQAIALATTSAFGTPAAFHTSQVARFTDTVYMGAWPRAVFDRVGLFDESLPPNEDYELNYRIRRLGGSVYLSPAIRSNYYGRQTLGALARQYFGYGQGKARMLKRHPTSLRPRQLVAPGFVAALALGALFAPRHSPLRTLWLLMLAAYAALNLGFSARLAHRALHTPRERRQSAEGASVGAGWARWRQRWRALWRLPVVFLTLHLCWGAGFWVGLSRPNVGGAGAPRQVRAHQFPQPQDRPLDVWPPRTIAPAAPPVERQR